MSVRIRRDAKLYDDGTRKPSRTTIENSHWVDS